MIKFLHLSWQNQINIPNDVSLDVISFASTISDSVDNGGEAEIIVVEIPATGDGDVLRSLPAIKVPDSVVIAESGILLSLKMTSAVIVFSVVISVTPIILVVVSLPLEMESESLLVDRLASVVDATGELSVVMVSVSSKEVASGIVVDVTSSSIEESVSEVGVFETSSDGAVERVVLGVVMAGSSVKITLEVGTSVEGLVSSALPSVIVKSVLVVDTNNGLVVDKVSGSVTPDTDVVVTESTEVIDSSLVVDIISVDEGGSGSLIMKTSFTVV